MNTLLKILAAITMILVSTASAVFILKEERSQSPAPAATVAAAPAHATAVAAATPAPAAAPAPAPTPGPSAVMTTNAWLAMKDNNYDEAEADAQKVITQFKQQALDEQKSLKSPVPTSDKDGVNKLWALNDVGTCYFILGQAYEKQNKAKDAAGAYQYLVDNLAYAECWDPRGWFWKPADGAKKQLTGLKLDTLD